MAKKVTKKVTKADGIIAKYLTNTSESDIIISNNKRC